MATDFSNKCAILSELWMNYRDDDNLADFVDYNDLGLPMAYLINTELVTVNPSGELFINETFDLLMAAIGLDVDNGYQTLNEMFTDADK